MSNHHCPGLGQCVDHPRWVVVRCRGSKSWLALAPGPEYDGRNLDHIPSHTQAIHYAQEKALADLPFASRTLPPEVVEAAREHLARKD